MRTIIKRDNPVEDGGPVREEHYYTATFGKVTEELPVSPDLDPGAAKHMQAIHYCYACTPPPSKVVYTVERHRGGQMVIERQDEIFQFDARMNTALTAPVEPIPLKKALDEWMEIAFPNGQPEVVWRAPEGFNDAMENLRAAYFWEKQKQNSH